MLYVSPCSLVRFAFWWKPNTLGGVIAGSLLMASKYASYVPPWFRLQY